MPEQLYKVNSVHSIKNVPLLNFIDMIIITSLHQISVVRFTSPRVAHSVVAMCNRVSDQQGACHLGALVYRYGVVYSHEHHTAHERSTHITLWEGWNRRRR